MTYPEPKKLSPIVAGVWRAIRGEVAIVICLYLSYLAQRPALIILAPVLLGISKFLRDKFGLDLKVI